MVVGEFWPCGCGPAKAAMSGPKRRQRFLVVSQRNVLPAEHQDDEHCGRESLHAADVVSPHPFGDDGHAEGEGNIRQHQGEPRDVDSALFVVTVAARLNTGGTDDRERGDPGEIHPAAGGEAVTHSPWGIVTAACVEYAYHRSNGGEHRA